jgi:hypothetical protein
MATYIQRIAMRLRMTGSEPAVSSLITPVKPINFPYTPFTPDSRDPSVHDLYPKPITQQVSHTYHREANQQTSPQQTGATKNNDTNKTQGYMQTILHRPVNVINQTFTSRQLTSQRGPEINITKEISPAPAADASNESGNRIEPVKKEMITFHTDHFHNVAGDVKENKSRMMPAPIRDNTDGDLFRMQPIAAPPIINLPKENKLVVGKISVEILPGAPAPVKTTERIITRVVSVPGNRRDERSRLSYGLKQY